MAALQPGLGGVMVAACSDNATGKSSIAILCGLLYNKARMTNVDHAVQTADVKLGLVSSYKTSQFIPFLRFSTLFWGQTRLPGFTKSQTAFVQTSCLLAAKDRPVWSLETERSRLPLQLECSLSRFKELFPYKKQIKWTGHLTLLIGQYADSHGCYG